MSQNITKSGSEFQVNTYTVDGQGYAGVGTFNWSFDKLTNLVKGVEYSHL